MKIECLLKRENGTQVELDDDIYDFQPNDKNEHIAEVSKKGHIDTLLAIPVYKEHGKAGAKTVNKTAPPPPPPADTPLQGLDWTPVDNPYGDGKSVTTAELVNQAFAMSGLSEAEWNALPRETVAEKLIVELDLLTDNTPPAPTEPDDKEYVPPADELVALRAEAKALKIPSAHLLGAEKLKAAIAAKKAG